MAWQDRLREAAYTSPSGTRIVFDYVAVARETTKRTTVFEFPGVADGYVQDNGHGPRRYPLQCFFSGDDHDVEASRFEAALLERGVGRLEHPLYGTFDTVPSGEITRRDDLRDAGNQTIVEVTFWTSISAIYPDGEVSSRNEILAALDQFEEAAAEQFADAADLSTVGAQENLQSSTKKLVDDTATGLEAIAAATTKIKAEFDDAIRELNDGLDVLIDDPTQLAEQIIALVMTPARAGAGIQSKLDAYALLLESTITAPAALPETSFALGLLLPGRIRTVANDFHLSVLVATATVAGAIRSVVETQFQARPHALNAAAAILDMLDDLVAWMDAGHDTLEGVGAPGGLDTGASYQAVQEAAAAAAAGAIDDSFDLVPERRIVIDRARTIIDLCAELYGDVDGKLELLIATNDFSGSQLLELPAGTSVVYYA